MGGSPSLPGSIDLRGRGGGGGDRQARQPGIGAKSVRGVASVGTAGKPVVNSAD